jgi:hypothetical protein
MRRSCNDSPSKVPPSRTALQLQPWKRRRIGEPPALATAPHARRGRCPAARRTLDDCFKLFDLIHRITTTHAAISRITREARPPQALCLASPVRVCSSGS